ALGSGDTGLATNNQTENVLRVLPVPCSGIKFSVFSAIKPRVYMLQLKEWASRLPSRLTQRPSLSRCGPFWKAIRQNMKDIKDISEKELTKLYAEYQAALGRPMPTV